MIKNGLIIDQGLDDCEKPEGDAAGGKEEKDGSQTVQKSRVIFNDDFNYYNYFDRSRVKKRQLNMNLP